MNWVYLLCAIAVVAIIRGILTITSRNRRNREMTQNLGEFMKRVEAIESRHLHEVETSTAIEQ